MSQTTDAADTDTSTPVDHSELADYVAVSSAHGCGRRLHRVDGNPSQGELGNGADCDVACKTTLTAPESSWRAKPAAVFPPGYYPLCDDPECFGDDLESDTGGDSAGGAGGQ